MGDGAKLTGAKGFHWRINWLILVFAGIFLPLTLALGYWQLGRAEEKTALLAASLANELAPPVTLAELSRAEDYNYRRVQVSGSFDNQRTILLQNRVRNGLPGYEVVEPFQEARSGRWLLVNRGWLPGAAGNKPPLVVPVEGKVLLSGHLYRSLGEPFTLGEEQWREGWPQVLQNLETEALAERLGVVLYPYTLRLDIESPGALTVGWPKVNIQPEKHRAYAVQWFAMAAALVMLSVFANSNLGEVIRRVWRRPNE
ncbi:MAG: SURF1 family protein [Porticoccaceae bacterium]|nr:SURF1 family protein [Porticoccaceae bacterium]